MTVTGFPENAWDGWLSGLYKEMFPSGTSYEVQVGHVMVVRLDSDTSVTDEMTNACGPRPDEMSTEFDPWFNCADGIYRWAMVLGPATWTNSTGSGVATLEYATYAEDVFVAVVLNGTAYDPNEFDSSWGNWAP
jgi:hypothetical protein